MLKTVIYTAIANSYDFLRPVPFELRKRYDFVCFSDNKKSGQIVNGWRIENLDGTTEDLTRACRNIKIHPHIHFKEYNSSLWIDANISFSNKMIDLIDSFNGSKAIIMGVKHPTRSCIYLEAKVCQESVKDKRDLIDQQTQKMRQAGYPEQFGLTETNILFRKHCESSVIAMMEEWWWWVSNMSKRDQLSFDYLRWKHGLEIKYINIDIHDSSKVFRRGLHRTGPLFRKSFALIEAYQMLIPWMPLILSKIYKLRRR